jgi:hypothetical protein
VCVAGQRLCVSDACVCECDGLTFCVVRLAVSLACFLACENSRGPVTTYIHIYIYILGWCCGVFAIFLSHALLRDFELIN